VDFRTVDAIQGSINESRIDEILVRVEMEKEKTGRRRRGSLFRKGNYTFSDRDRWRAKLQEFRDMLELTQPLVKAISSCVTIVPKSLDWDAISDVRETQRL
jgi:hypothetical protein